MTKFDAGISGTFSGAPGSDARPAETSQDSGLIPEKGFSIRLTTSRQGTDDAEPRRVRTMSQCRRYNVLLPGVQVCK